MAGNAHGSRHRKHFGGITPADCMYCENGTHQNKNGHRHNPASKRAGRRNEAAKVQKHQGKIVYHKQEGYDFHSPVFRK